MQSSRAWSSISARRASRLRSRSRPGKQAQRAPPSWRAAPARSPPSRSPAPSSSSAACRLDPRSGAYWEWRERLGSRLPARSTSRALRPSSIGRCVRSRAERPSSLCPGPGFLGRPISAHSAKAGNPALPKAGEGLGPRFPGCVKRADYV